MTAVILAGGLGTRLRSVVPDKPKVLADVGGRPFIEYLLDQLAREGVQSVVLCTGYMGDQIQNRLGTAYNKMALSYSREPHPLGTGGALRLALPMLESDTVLVLNGDSYCGARLNEFMAWHAQRQSNATILLVETDDTRRYGRVQIDDEGRILLFMEKTDTEGPGWINAGIYLVKRQIIESIETGRAVSIEREVFPGWVGKGLHGFRCEGRLWDIGLPTSYAQANAELVSNIRSKCARHSQHN
jgi:D-glycero-alpha-D-manno-heptose 1-phosphate guanylyltransferase